MDLDHELQDAADAFTDAFGISDGTNDERADEVVNFNEAIDFDLALYIIHDAFENSLIEAAQRIQSGDLSQLDIGGVASVVLALSELESDDDK
jgi:hypothetical protein